jgi:hypothetical protein
VDVKVRRTRVMTGRRQRARMRGRHVCHRPPPPPQAPQDGEVVSMLADGDPCDYGGCLVTLAPYFGVPEVGVTTFRG